MEVEAVINEITQRKLNKGLSELDSFIKSLSTSCITQKGDEKTNIIDQGAKTTYCLSDEQLGHLYDRLEMCRKEGSITHFSEKQGSKTIMCGLMLDYDIITANNKPTLTDHQYYRITNSLVSNLQRNIDFSVTKKEIILHVFFIVKPQAVAKSDTTFKYGFHILVPGVKISRAHKKWIMKEFEQDPATNATLKELGAINDDCLDKNSASVPVLFFGSCKRGGIPYKLGAALEVRIESVDPSLGWMPTPVIRQLSSFELEKYNLVAELSLTINAANPLRLIDKQEYHPFIHMVDKVKDWGNRSCGGILSNDELWVAENALTDLINTEPKARHLHALLDILDITYCTERGKWRDVIFAIANTAVKNKSQTDFKPLAVWFSQKCPIKWNSAALDSLWQEALTTTVEYPVTEYSIYYWAKACNPERYARIHEQSHFAVLSKYVYEFVGKLQHYMLADVLHLMLGQKFCVDIDSGARGLNSYCWFEFVTPGQPMKPGEVWKWRKEVEPDELQIFISGSLSKMLNDVSGDIKQRAEKAQNPEHATYFKSIIKAYSTSKTNVFNDTFKNGIIRQAAYLFRKRGFAEKLDKIPYLFGTLNGVLKLGPKCSLIDYYHEYPISRFSPVAYIRFDPYKPNVWQKIILDAIADIIIEPDARDWILFHAAQGLSGDPKEGLLLLWEGGGQNGKTSFLRWVAKALGPYADKFNIQLMCCDREDADKPNSAMMKFKHLNYAYSEESNKAQTLNVARMKEMVNAGEVSGRDLHSKQETFTMKANMVAASQYSFIVNTTDHGTWRRLRHYTSKTKFRKNPDPNNIYEKKEEQKFILQYPSDPAFQSAFLSILVHYYERLQNEYAGELKNVPCHTIEAETEVFRSGQDALHRWITQNIVISPVSIDYSLSVLSTFYIDWYSINIERKKHIASEIIKELESSAIGKFLRPIQNGTMILQGCRVLTKDSMTLLDGEKMLIDYNLPKKADIASFTSTDEWWIGNQPNPITIKCTNKTHQREFYEEDINAMNIISQTKPEMNDMNSFLEQLFVSLPAISEKQKKTSPKPNDSDLAFDDTAPPQQTPAPQPQRRPKQKIINDEEQDYDPSWFD